MNCSYCKNQGDTETMKQHRIPGGIRGCGPGHTIYLCDDNCLQKFQKEEQCQNCKCTGYKHDFIDGYYVCSNDSHWMEYPTCLEQYTGIYTGGFCDEEKNVNDNRCYILENYNDYYVKYMCSACFTPYKKCCNAIYCDKSWTKLIDKDNEMIFGVLEKNDHQFICGKCNEIKYISQGGIYIVDNMNVCGICKK
jgi:hypothetical protein